MQKPFWLVWNEAASAPRFKHHTPQAAKAEAERLARANPGQKFHVLALIGTCQKTDVEWVPVDDIPF